MLEKTRFFTYLSTSLVIALIIQMTACGTLLYPERRGQTTGKIDTGVAVLDAVGLIFFIVPGVAAGGVVGIVAFAVDFATGAIFLPPGQDKTKVFAEGDYPIVTVDLKTLDQKKIEAVIREHTGKTISLGRPDLITSKIKDRRAFLHQYELWALNRDLLHQTQHTHQ